MSAVRFAPIERQTVAEEIREAIGERIRNGELAPGSKLPSERELCEQFGVARTSVREAIQGLTTLGLLEKRANRSYVVEHLPNISFDGDDRRKRRVSELFEVRQVVEIPIARRAAVRASAADRAAIAELAARFNPDMPLAEFRELDRQFHWAVARGCGNATLAELYGKVLESLFQSTELDELLTARSNRKVVREVIQKSAAAHQAIARAIAEGDWSAVAEEAEHHLDQVENQMISRMS